MAALLAVLFFLGTFTVAAIAVFFGSLALTKKKPYPGEEPSSETAQAANAGLLRDESISTISVWNRVLGGFDFVDILRTHVEQAGLNWSVGRVTLAMLLSGTLCFAALSAVAWVPGLGIVLGSAFAASLPYLYIRHLRGKRFRAFEENLPDALDSITRSLRAGYPFASALELVANEAEQPVAGELRRTAIEGNYGTSWDRALENLAERVPLLEVSLFASAVQLHMRTGGKLGEVLGRLSETMRESVSLKGEVRAIAAHGKLTGTILTLLPLGITAMMLIVAPSYLAVLIQHPDGKYFITAAVACLITGHFVIRKLVDIKV